MIQVGDNGLQRANDILDGNRNLACNRPPVNPQRVVAKFLACKESITLFTRGFGFNFLILTRHGYELVHPARPKGRLTFTRVLPPVRRRPLVIIFLFDYENLSQIDEHAYASYMVMSLYITLILRTSYL